MLDNEWMYFDDQLNFPISLLIIDATLSLISFIVFICQTLQEHRRNGRKKSTWVSNRHFIIQEDKNTTDDEKHKLAAYNKIDF